MRTLLVITRLSIVSLEVFGIIFLYSIKAIGAITLDMLSEVDIIDNVDIILCRFIRFILENALN